MRVGCWIAAVMVLAAPSFAKADDQYQAVLDAVAKRYPDSKAEMVREMPINGITVCTMKIKSPKGETSAILTDKGEFLMAGVIDWNPDDVPGPVKAVLDGFAEKPEAIEKFNSVLYRVNVMMGKRVYRLEYDAVGRLYDLQSSFELEETLGPKASADEVAAVTPWIGKYFNKASILGITEHADVPGFFVVHLTADDDAKDVTCTMTPSNGEVAEWTVDLTEDKLPDPVVTNLNGLFKNAKFKSACRVNSVYYRVNQMMPAGDYIVMRINSLGDVKTISSDVDDLRPDVVVVKKKG